MRPFGAAVHLRKGTVNLRLVGWMVLGSVPMAFLGAYLLHLMGNAKSAQKNIEMALGAALLLGAARDGAALRPRPPQRAGPHRARPRHRPHPLRTVAIGDVGGLIVGMTSVGSGSLMIVMLLFLYPMIGANQLVGTDLTQAVPLTARGGARGARLRSRRVRRHGLADHRQRARRARRIAALLERSPTATSDR